MNIILYTIISILTLLAVLIPYIILIKISEKFQKNITSLVLISILTWFSTLVPLLFLIKLETKLAFFCSLLPVFLVVYFVVTCKDQKSVDDLLSSMFTKAVRFGFIALLVGYIGRIVFVPKDDLAFLWGGIFIAPLGILIGIYWSLFKWIVVEKILKKRF